MAKLNSKTIHMLAELSRISCSEEDEASLLQDLQRIIDYIEQLGELDTEDTPPCNTVSEGIVNTMREDIPGKVMPRKIFLDNASQHTSGMIRVPPIIKK